MDCDKNQKIIKIMNNQISILESALIKLFYNPEDKKLQENYIEAVDHRLAEILHDLHYNYS